VSPLTLVPFSQNPLAVAAQQILEHYKVRLPDWRIPLAEDQCAVQSRAFLVRRWLLDDIQPIASVTEDRRLARRVRAMLQLAARTTNRLWHH